jgi:hypothetical protein
MAIFPKSLFPGLPLGLAAMFSSQQPVILKIPSPATVTISGALLLATLYTSNEDAISASGAITIGIRASFASTLDFNK